ncbi:MAG: hypothetical protein KF683_01700 [Rubrivivax sp.]|nr:hypothetical protein [Rubrivivax sp.]
MNRKRLALLACAAVLAVGSAGATPAEVAEKTVDRVTDVAVKVENAVKRGLQAAGRGIDRGAEATGRVVTRVASRVGAPTERADAAAAREAAREAP